MHRFAPGDSVVWRSVDRKERIVQTVWPWTVRDRRRRRDRLVHPGRHGGQMAYRRTRRSGGSLHRAVGRRSRRHNVETHQRRPVAPLRRSLVALARLRHADMGSGVAIYQPRGPVASHPDRVRFAGPLPRSRRRTRRPRLAVEGRGRTCVGRRAGSPRRGTRRRDPRRWRAGDQGRPRDGIARRMENVAAGSALAHSDRSRPVAQVRAPRER